MPKRVSGDIEMSLRRRIEAGEWSESLRLPNERRLASEYGVARNTIRAAMERLGADGGVRREVGRGTFLQRSLDGDLTAVMRTLIGVSPADTMAVRQIIEPKAAALAATKGNLADLDAIAAAHEAAVEGGRVRAVRAMRLGVPRTDLRCVAQRTARLASCDPEVHPQSGTVARNQAALLQPRAAARTIATSTRRSFKLLLRRDSEAAERAMLAHLDSVGRNLLNAV